METTQEYLTGNRKIRYPFADDSLLSTSESNARTIFGCFVDAYVQMKESSSTIVPSVKNISISGTTLSFDLVGDGITPVVNLTCTVSDNRFITIRNESTWCWYTFVISSDGIRELSEISNDIDISNDELQFSKRCIGYSTPGVLSLKVYDGNKIDETTGRRYTQDEALLRAPYKIVKGDVIIQAGHNISFSSRQAYTAVSGTVNSNEITINAIPGAGVGRIPCDCSDAVIFKSPGLLSNDGHSVVLNDTCYDLVPIRYSGESADLKVHAKCKACCTCEMYASLVNEKLVPLKDTILDIEDSLEITNNKYEQNVIKWNNRLAKAEPEDIAISVTGVPLEAAATKLSGSKVKGKMSRCSFSAMVRNDSFVTVTIEISRLTSNGSIFEKQISYIDESLEPQILRMPGDSATIRLPPGRSATLTCFIRLGTNVTTDQQTGFIAYVTITAKQDDRLITSQRKGFVL